MHRKLAVCLVLVLLTAVTALADDAATETEQEPAETNQEATETGRDSTEAESDAKELSGMSIVGNDEAPKSLYIVPWKSSEIGVETSLNTLLNEGDMPVDRDVFMRQLEFYGLSTAQ